MRLWNFIIKKQIIKKAMLYTVNPYVIESDNVLFMHMIIVDSDNELVMNLG